MADELLKKENEEPTEVVELSDWEHCKENIVPLRRGRNARQLAAVCSLDGAESAVDARIEAQKKYGSSPVYILLFIGSNLPFTELGRTKSPTTLAKILWICGHGAAPCCATTIFVLRHPNNLGLWQPGMWTGHSRAWWQMTAASSSSPSSNGAPRCSRARHCRATVRTPACFASGSPT